MTNPNLAWFIACICCFILGLVFASDDLDEEILGKIGLIAFAGSIAYCAISFLLIE